MAGAQHEAAETRLLRGFSDALDFRPISFSRPPPPQHICGLCGMVSLLPVLPGCLHSYCRPCHELVLSEKPPKCPRDQMSIYASSFATPSYAMQSAIVKKYGMRCPNAPHGCTYVLKGNNGIAGLEGHYSKCEFYKVSCRVCGASVLRERIVDHLKDGCKAGGAGNVGAKAKKVVLNDVE